METIALLFSGRGGGGGGGGAPVFLSGSALFIHTFSKETSQAKSCSQINRSK